MFLKSPLEGWKCNAAVVNGNLTAGDTLLAPLSLLLVGERFLHPTCCRRDDVASSPASPKCEGFSFAKAFAW